MTISDIFGYIPHYLRLRFDRKYIVIESDDWGLERAISKDSIKWMNKKFGEENLSRWSYDSLESKEDLEELYSILESYKSKFEFPPVITANFITHNIDYSNSEKLNFIPISKRNYDNSENLKILYTKGIERNYIFPQLHGYCHYNLTYLRNYFDTEEGREAFKIKYLSARSTIKKNLKFLQGELSRENLEANKLEFASEEFKNYFGFYSSSFIPPTFILDKVNLKILIDSKVKTIQSSNRLITSNNKKFNIPYFKKRNGIKWSIRNARLDPHKQYNYNHEQCIDSVEKAFTNNSPAVIDFHRVNFAGRFAPEYREKTMNELKSLLAKIYLKWPEANFISTQKLNDILWQQETK